MEAVSPAPSPHRTRPARQATTAAPRFSATIAPSAPCLFLPSLNRNPPHKGSVPGFPAGYLIDGACYVRPDARGSGGLGHKPPECVYNVMRVSIGGCLTLSSDSASFCPGAGPLSPGERRPRGAWRGAGRADWQTSGARVDQVPPAPRC